MKHPYIPKGCDQQGRYPEAAESATDVGVPDEDAPQQDVFRVVLSDLAIAAAIAGAILVIVSVLTL